eukprot:15518002-Heterocapsa_arctica.AAC.1
MEKAEQQHTHNKLHNNNKPSTLGHIKAQIKNIMNMSIVEQAEVPSNEQGKDIRKRAMRNAEQQHMFNK